MKTLLSTIFLSALLIALGCSTSDTRTVCFDTGSGVKCVQSSIEGDGSQDVDGDGQDDTFLCADDDSSDEDISGEDDEVPASLEDDGDDTDDGDDGDDSDDVESDNESDSEGGCEASSDESDDDGDGVPDVEDCDCM